MPSTDSAPGSPISIGLGMPRPATAPASLFDALVHAPIDAHVACPLQGPPLVRASRLPAPMRAAPVRVVVDLDVDPAGVPLEGAHRIHVDIDDDEFDDACALALPAPLVVFGRGARTPADRADHAQRTGVIPGLDLTAGPDAIADFLSVVAHGDTGFVARTGHADGVLEILAATVAALTGDDVRRAVASPDPTALAALPPAAATAVREVLLGVVVTDATGLGALERRLGSTPTPSPRFAP
ncbi:hypothetical protein DW322_03945 [Rhodococcus rhodnii]|uniref:Uncharacterized protein n=2 Tax=Rhodococcus rhodnii TaxID=38312 RepID=R7WLQ0_9NOCA|nr:hypothetical protein [Rhodococcus rhodnii]EOM76246.1 hypothetical protein Rrhod_2405 [Rhodococcus rhodnii LMG 5362]TXG89531.1 hypothetical protein DW322_03945 [Rhodococcus rhodnii]